MHISFSFATHLLWVMGLSIISVLYYILYYYLCYIILFAIIYDPSKGGGSQITGWFPGGRHDNPVAVSCTSKQSEGIFCRAWVRKCILL